MLMASLPHPDPMLVDLWTPLIAPTRAFRAQAARPHHPVWAPLRMLAWRCPATGLALFLQARAYGALLQDLREGTGPISAQLAGFGIDPFLLQACARDLPSLPDLRWLLLATPLVLIGTWMHHWCWDHAALWILRAARPRTLARTSEAEVAAMTASTLLDLPGLLAWLPVAGPFLAPLGWAAGLWAWGLRGMALAAWHELPVWKGILATVLHVVLVLMFYGCLLLTTGGIMWLWIR